MRTLGAGEAAAAGAPSADGRDRPRSGDPSGTRVARQFGERMSALRDQLRGALERQTHEEIAASAQRINQTIEPYRRFIERSGSG
jgi:hypothetical protein